MRRYQGQQFGPRNHQAHLVRKFRGASRVRLATNLNPVLAKLICSMAQLSQFGPSPGGLLQTMLKNQTPHLKAAENLSAQHMRGADTFTERLFTMRGMQEP